MSRRFVSLCIAALFWARPASASVSLEDARMRLRNGDFHAAVVDLAILSEDSKDPSLISEHAYALAAAGLTEAALAQLDRATAIDPRNREVRFVLSALFQGLGLQDAARGLAEPRPAWLAAEAPALGNLRHEHVLGPYAVELLAADFLRDQGRFASAAVALGRLTRVAPDTALGWAAYAIALERLGAFESAASAMRRHLQLVDGRLEASDQAQLAAYAGELDKAAATRSQQQPIAGTPEGAPAAPASPAFAYTSALDRFQAGLTEFTGSRLSTRNDLILEAPRAFLHLSADQRGEWLDRAFDRWSEVLQASGAPQASPWIETVWSSGGAVWNREGGVITRVALWSNGTPPER